MGAGRPLFGLVESAILFQRVLRVLTGFEVAQRGPWVRQTRNATLPIAITPPRRPDRAGRWHQWPRRSARSKRRCHPSPGRARRCGCRSSRRSAPRHGSRIRSCRRYLAMTTSQRPLGAGLEVLTPPCRGRFRPFAPRRHGFLPPGLAGCRILTEKWVGKRALKREPFVAPPRLTPRTPERVRGATGAAGWVVKCPSSGLQLA